MCMHTLHGEHLQPALHLRLEDVRASGIRDTLSPDPKAGRAKGGMRGSERSKSSWK